MEGGRGNIQFPRGGKQAFAEGENVRNREVSKERSEASRRQALERSERERSDEWAYACRLAEFTKFVGRKL